MEILFRWNAAVDEQAIDRVHRIGQIRPVTVVRFICSDTIEDRILQMQVKMLNCLVSCIFSILWLSTLLRSREKLTRKQG